jgi:hypothetical protein
VRIVCYTLFDITKTNVNVRRFNLDSVKASATLVKQRGQQSNFETVLQIISMRAQPEDITVSEKLMESAKNEKWGTLIHKAGKIPHWRFEFTVSYPEVFDDGENKLGYLFKDCSDVPMITKLEEWFKLENKLDITPDGRNIYFELINE